MNKKLTKSKKSQITIELSISSKQWQSAKIRDKNKDEEIRALTFNEQEFFFENEDNKVNIDFGFGSIKVPKERFKRELNKYGKK